MSWEVAGQALSIIIAVLGGGWSYMRAFRKDLSTRIDALTVQVAKTNGTVQVLQERSRNTERDVVELKRDVECIRANCLEQIGRGRHK